MRTGEIGRGISLTGMLFDGAAECGLLEDCMMQVILPLVVVITLPLHWRSKKAFDEVVEVIAAARDDHNSNSILDFYRGNCVVKLGADVIRRHKDNFVFG